VNRTYFDRLKTPALVALASLFILALPATIGSAMAEVGVTHQARQIEHITIETAKKFADVVVSLESTVPALDPEVRAALVKGDEQHALDLEKGAKLFIFLKRDAGALLQVIGRPAKALQYEIGNPLTATRMTRHQLPAALYAPLRVVLYENAAGGTTFEYDKPSTLFGQFGDEAVTAVGRELDAELESILKRAAE
jgi:uncharacterized protein (DUF302 family)